MMYNGGFDNGPKDFEKNLKNNQAKWVVVFIVTLLISIILFGCSESNSNISEKNKIETAIKIFFDGFHKKDSLIIKSVIENSFELKSVSFQNENAFINNLNGDKFISAVVNRNEAPVWNEKLISFEIKIDGPLANAWVEYEFWLDDKLSHCGVNSFHLLKKESGWKIFTITDSRRKNCSK